MKVCVVSANMGYFDPPMKWYEQVLPENVDVCDFVCWTDENFPPRTNSMTPRLQARIPKMFGWQMSPGYDVYLWVDSSCSLLHEESVAWFLERLGSAQAVFFRHPDRKTVKEEAGFLSFKLAEGNRYLTPRYAGELLEAQMAELLAGPDWEDDLLIASTAFAYRNHTWVHEMLKEWWYHTSRYHSIDQLSLPYVLKRSMLKYNLIEENYMKTPYLTYTRNLARRVS